MATSSNNFLLYPRKIEKHIVDFKKTELPENGGRYAVILDNCLSEAECQALIAMAEEQTGGRWEQAMVNVGQGRQRLISEVRDCDRIIWDDQNMVNEIWSRIKDSVPEIDSLYGMPTVTGTGPSKRKETLKISRLNERMRFLRYGKGQYFRPHMDGSFVTPDGSEISYYTLHLYLNEDGIGGGATTFYSYGMDRTYDVKPKVGRVLIFQHRDLMHAGDDVTSGLKYTLRTDIMYKKSAE